MMFQKKKEDSLARGVLLAYVVLILHVLLIPLMAILVVFFHGFVSYLPWIFVAGSLTLIGFGFYLFKRMKKEGKSLKEILRSPLFKGRPVEISFLGGMASFKIGNEKELHVLDTEVNKASRQLEDPATMKLRELNELSKLLEKNLITQQEFNTIKNQIIGSSR